MAFRVTNWAGRVVCTLVGILGVTVGTASASTVREFPQPNVIAIAGTAHSLWFATPTRIGRLDGTGHMIASYGLPAGVAVVNRSPGEPFPTDSNDGMWFTAVRAGARRNVSLIGYVTPGGQIHLHALARGHGGPVLARDGRGNLWFADHVTRHHKRLVAIGELTSKGHLKDVRLPGSRPDVVGLAPGPGKQTWFTSCSDSPNSAYLGRIDARGHLRTFSLTGPYCPGDIVQGPDGAMWFTATLTMAGPHQDKICRINSGGPLTCYSTGNWPVEPSGITVGPDRALWFSEQSTPAIARMTTSGSSSQAALPRSSQPTQIVRGPGDAVWFLDRQTGGYPSDPSTQIGVVSGGRPGVLDSLI